MKLTAGLKALLVRYESQLSEIEFGKLWIDLQAGIRYYIKDLKEYSPGIERGKRVHSLIDAEVKKVKNIEISCRKGCAACCHYEVEITKDDAAILESAIKAGSSFSPTRLHSHAKRVRHSKDWQMGAVAANRCPFLGDNNACQAYESRPSACRILSVESPAEECEKINGNPIQHRIPMAEIILTAAINSKDNRIGQLSKMLAAELETPVDNTSSMTL